MCDSADSLGAWSFQSDFAAIGSSAESVLGVCEVSTLSRQFTLLRFNSIAHHVPRNLAVVLFICGGRPWTMAGTYLISYVWSINDFWSCWK